MKNIMGKIKRVTLVMLAALSCVTFSSCDFAEEDDGRLTVVATDFALYDFARAVCGDYCNVRMLLSPGSESHDFEATLEDIALLAETDVFVYVGGESEEWVPDVLEAAGASDVTSVCAVELVKTYTVETVEGMEHDEDTHEHEHEDGETDEHVWTSIPNAITIMNAIGDAVLSKDENFEKRSGEYVNELLEIDADIREIVSSAKRNTLVIADRFPFRYFTEEYGLSYYAAFSGCTSSVEPSLSTVNFLIERVREYEIPAVFVIEFSDGTAAQAISRETGADVLELHSAHNVSREDFENGVTYADLMRKNAENLKIALN